MNEREHDAGEGARLSHVDERGDARMVDVSGKPVTERVATAEGRLRTRPEVIRLIAEKGLPKGDVLSTARLAGIQAAKRVDELIPLAHSLPLDGVDVELELEADAVAIQATARVTGRTGVEMEALTAVVVTGLTLHDMIKAVDPEAELGGVHLLEKSGGKRGRWVRGMGGPAASGDPSPAEVPAGTARPRVASVIVSSTRGARGERPDTTGPVLHDWLRERGFEVSGPVVVADADLAATLRDELAARPLLVITTGGTGVTPSDRTPEATAPLLDQELPGIAEALRAAGREATPTAALSRGLAGIGHGAVIVNLPGSSGGVRDGIAVLDPILDHLLEQIAGGDHV